MGTESKRPRLNWHTAAAVSTTKGSPPPDHQMPSHVAGRSRISYSSRLLISGVRRHTLTLSHTHRLLRQHHCNRKVGQPVEKAGHGPWHSTMRRSCSVFGPISILLPRVAVSPNSSVDGRGFASPIARANSDFPVVSEV